MVEEIEHRFFDPNIPRKSRVLDENLGPSRDGDAGPPFFSLIEFNLSGLCNRTCVFCPRANPEVYPNVNEHIPVELYEKTMKELAEVDYDGMILYSAFGEPLLYKNIEAVLEISKQYCPNVRNETVTDGDFVTTAKLRSLFSAGLDTLLRRDAALNTNQLCTEKSAGYLKWRYQDQVSFTYLALLAEKAGRLPGELDGSIIVRPYQANGLRGLIIEELLLASPEPKVVARLVGEAVRVFNADVLTAYFNPASVQHTLLKSQGFRRDLRKKVNVVMRELNPSPGPNPQLAQTWGLSMGDLEIL
ncbi:MAG: hypothetical protein IIC33_08190 [Chloroflexi bacterium]|nr:hypothetical protein [Chloroflexota bacterium]